MNRTVWSRASAVLALVLLLTPAAFAAPPKARPEPGFVASLLAGLDRLLPSLLKSSATTDPDGKPQLATPTGASTSDNGAEVDPNGRT